MKLRLPLPRQRPGWLLARIARDTAGNTLAMIAAALIPLLAMVGGGVDVSRGYLAQSRLQQACDAGVLAARKRLGSNLMAGVLSTEARNAGRQFFDINFRDGMYGTERRDFAMNVEPDFSVSGRASVVVPTTIMNIFGYTEMPLVAECAAQLSMSNTDVMMVLDTTGSMTIVNPGDTKNRMETMKDVLRSFYAQLGAAASPATRIRYGFVPYSTNVNVGHLLREEWMVDEWSYHYRTWNAGPKTWTYDRYVTDLKFLRLGTGTKQFRIGGSAANATNVAVGWAGCIEERGTYEIADYANVDLTRALDLDIDLVPDPSKPATLWRPLLGDLSFLRGIGGGTWAFIPNPITTTQDYVNASWWGYSACPPKARKLATMSAAEFDAYVSALQPRGSTYHDIGMIWGGRLISPTGLFAADNADLPGAPTSRNLIFMTDGQTQPLDLSYASYGIEPFDQRRWRPTSPLSLTQTVEKRFAFVCNEVKKRNVTVWVVAFGTTLNPMFVECAGPGHSFEAADAVSLQKAFDQIARRIGDLRISR